MTRADLQALRNPLLVLAATLLASATLLWYTDLLLAQAHQQLARAQAQLKEARMRLQRSGDEREIIVRYLDAFQRLERAGFVGEEARINWLDGLRLANQQAGLFGVDYQIGIQRPYPYAADLDPGQIALNHSPMRLRFRLLHEEDLVHFFSLLARQDVGLFTVDQCLLRRIETGGTTRYQPNLSAECELSWITAKVPAGERK
jgi:hypothetical protein